MRIVVDGIIYGRTPGGGIARYWTEVLAILSRLEYSVRVDVIVPPGVKSPPCGKYHTRGGLTASVAVVRADIFHTSYYTHWAKCKQPSVVTAYDFIDASLPLFQPNGASFVEWQLDSLRRASAIIAISRVTRELALKLTDVDPARVFVAYPAVNIPFSLPLPGTEEILLFRKKYTGGVPYLLHVGMRRNYKNFRTILRAFCLAAPVMDRDLLIIGDEYPFAADELDWVVAAGLTNRIHYYPRFNDSTLRLAYAGADAMVSASLMEGFGIPVIEALVCGTGLILSDIPVYREIASGKALFVKAYDIDAWVSAMKGTVYISPSWREEVLNQYTWEAAARTHMSAYESVLR